ncbi:MAG: glycosyltransferase family 1 protein [Herpetosiphon sp.]
MAADSDRPIFLNDNIYSHRHERGVTRCFNEATDGVIARYGRRAVICSPQRRSYGAAKVIRSVRFRGSWRLGLHDKIVMAAAFWEKPAVVYNSYYGNAVFDAPEVFVVYDLIYELFPSYFPRTEPFVQRVLADKRRCIERGARLIAISENTASDIVRLYPRVDPETIAVVHLGVDDRFFQSAAPEGAAPMERPYLLYVGNRQIYKNFRRVLCAFAQAGFSCDVMLRVITPRSGGFDQEELSLITRFNLGDRVELLSSVSEVTLRACYASAIALVYPSEYEGFGLPILEAFASGTLVACAGTSSMPEVGGDVALYFDPTDIDSMSACLVQTVEMSTWERNRRIVAGQERARHFSWARFQDRTNAILETFL